jgi:hypothetical protein
MSKNSILDVNFTFLLFLVKGQWQQKFLLFHLKERLKSSLKSCYICFISCLILEIF